MNSNVTGDCGPCPSGTGSLPKCWECIGPFYWTWSLRGVVAVPLVRISRGWGALNSKKNKKMHLVVHKNSLHFHNIYEKLEVFDGWRAMACIMVNLPDFHAIKSCKLDNLANIDERQSN